MLGHIYEVYIQAKEEFELEKKVFKEENLFSSDMENIIAAGDNFSYYLSFAAQGKELDLIYMDPPFFSMSNYSSTVKTSITADEEKAINLKVLSYKDSWSRKDGKIEYLKYLTKILLVSKECLKDGGVVWVHLDWHIAHYIKVLMDEIYGEGNFLNEIIWTYKSGGSGGNTFAKKHDTLLVYSNNGKVKLNVPKEKSYNRGYKPYNFKGVAEYEDDIGWYTLVNMKDVWQIDMVGRTSKERNGYATQKPKELLRRIIESSSKEGDLCGDFFGGSGAFAMTCTELNRRFVSSDKNKLSLALLEKFCLENKVNYSLDLQSNISEDLFEKSLCVSIKNTIEGYEIVGYNLDLNKINLAKEEREKAEVQLRKEPTSFISYYIIYSNNKAKIISSENGRLNLKFNRDINFNKEVVVVDIFGNRVKLDEGYHF